MAQTALTEVNTPQDVIINEWDQRYTREVVTFRHTTGSNTSFQPGLICEISGGKHIPLATAANAASILLSYVYLLATATDLSVTVLKRGPALVNEDQLNANGQTLATAVTALNGLSPPILTMKQPIKRNDLAA
jgi:hypothetical protein